LHPEVITVARFRSLPFFFALLLSAHLALAADAPKFIQKDGRWAFLVDGQPYLILGGQIHNSSAWPSELPQVWKSAANLHANTIAAPIYWEQFEPQQGQFDYANIEALIHGAREHHLHLVLLWFGTWKNGNMHYVPEWIKTNPQKYPRMINRQGDPIDVLSANSRANLEADKTAFAALMRHLKSLDNDEHTVLMVQVENESGAIGSVRDFSSEANATFAGQVPADVLKAVNKQPGSWSQVFGADADETFQVCHVARYVNEVAAAGKSEFAIPLYANVWLSYPPAELPERRMAVPGIQYPSGGAVQKYVGLWRALAPALDAIGPDIYASDSGFANEVLAAYNRPDNPLWIPEMGRGDDFAKLMFYMLGDGAIGFSPFGIDEKGWNILGEEHPQAEAHVFELLGPISRELAKLNLAGKLKTSVEELGKSQQELDFGPWQVTVAYGYPQYDGRRPPGTKDAHGAAVVAQLGPDEFLVTGIDAALLFHVAGKLPGIRMQILSAQEGVYENGSWKTLRLWNGDETDRGLQFRTGNETIRIKLGRF
jgi:beta-galactosidase GanA